MDLEEKRVQEGMDWIGLGNRIEPLVVSYLLKRIMGSSENRVPLDPLVNHHCCIVCSIKIAIWEYSPFSDTPILYCSGSWFQVRFLFLTNG